MTDNNENDDNSQAPTPTVNWDNNDDDNEPPAAGACVVSVEDEDDEVTISKAPTSEPTHRAKPNRVVVA